MSKKKDKGFAPATVPPGTHAQPPAKAADIKRIPKDWEPIWDEDFEEAFDSLLPKQRLFVVELVRTGFNKAEAFRRAYPDSTHSSAIVGVILAKPEVEVILSRFTDWAKQNMFEAQQVVAEAMKAKKRTYHEGAQIDEVDDHAIRLKAVEVLNKLEDAKKEAKTVKPAGTVNINFVQNFNAYLQQQGMAPIKIPQQQVADVSKGR